MEILLIHSLVNLVHSRRLLWQKTASISHKTHKSHKND